MTAQMRDRRRASDVPRASTRELADLRRARRPAAGTVPGTCPRARHVPTRAEFAILAAVGRTTTRETVEDAELVDGVSSVAVPGLVLVHDGNGPALRGAPVRGGIELGRRAFAGAALDDERVSRHHARVRREADRWAVEDLGSRNGTFVDGERITGTVRIDSPRVVRVGRSLFVPVRDVRRFEHGTIVRRGDALVGPTLGAAWDEIERAARFGDALLVTGESGAGKELAARAFHSAGPRASGPFIAVNCAAIPEGLAERLLFGAKRGAYSGATADADGYLQAADGGTLFLDEIADLDLAVQAKLLRALEAKEVNALGSARARPIDVRVCSATHDLRAAVAAGRFREDLFFRVGRPEVVLPALRDRAEEIPWLVAGELARTRADLKPHVAFVEACMLRRWPGNVRELLGEVRRAAQRALGDERDVVEPRDLSSSAGAGFDADAPTKSAGAIDREAVERALREANGNVTAAARALGVHRNQLRRLLAKDAIDPKELASRTSAAPDGDD